MESLKSNYRRAVFIWVAMVLSIFLYALVVELMRINPALHKRPSPFPETATLRYIFFSLGIAAFFLIRFVPNQILSGKPAPNRANQGSFFLPMISRLLNASILTWALCEAVAIYGLVLFFLTNNPFDFYLFLVLSLTYFAFHFPRYDRWEEAIHEVEGEGKLEIFARS